MSTKIEFKHCCTNPKRYVIRFTGESFVKYCETHFIKKDMYGAIVIHDLKLKKNIELPFNNLEIKGTRERPTGLSPTTTTPDNRFDD